MNKDVAVVLANLLEQVVADRATGQQRSRSEYLALYPGFEDEVDRKLDELAAPAADVAASNAADDGNGAETIGPYRVLGELGRGGQGVVLLAEDTRLPRRVALKVLSLASFASEDALSRFRREARVASRLDLPGICTVHDTGVDRGSAWIAMQYVEGRTLSEYVAEARASGSRGPVHLPARVEEGPEAADENSATHVTRAIRLVERLAQTLHEAHEAGVVHRDVKTKNVMVTPQGEPVLLDFGLATADDDGTLTRSGEVFGTPASMAPEQLLGRRHEVDRRTDVWALGVMLYELLTLQAPFEDESREGLRSNILNRDPTDARRLNTSVPRDLVAVLEKALEKRPARRYATARAFAEDLGRVLRHLPVHARRATTATRVVRWVQRNRAASLAMLSLAAGLVASLVLLVQVGEEQGRTADALDEARSEALVGAAERSVNSNPLLALHLGLAASEARQTPLALGAVYEALAGLHESALFDHEGRIDHVAMSADGRTLVSVGHQGIIRIWDVANPRTERMVIDQRPPDNPAPKRSTELILLHKDTRLLTAFGAHGARLWAIDGEEPEELACFPHPSWLWSIDAFPSGDRFVSIGQGGTIRIWDLDQPEQPVHSIAPTDQTGTKVLCSPDDTHLLVFHEHSGWRLRNWNLVPRLLDRDGVEIATLVGHDGPITDARFSLNGKQVLTASADGTARLWSLDGEPLRVLSHGSGWLRRVAFGPGDEPEYVLTGDANGKIFLWPLDGSPRQVLTGHSRLIHSLHASANGPWILSVSGDQTARLWDGSGHDLLVLRGHHGDENLISTSFARDAARLTFLTASTAGTIRVWHPWTAGPPVLLGHSEVVIHVRFSSTGDEILTTSRDDSTRIWDAMTGESRQVIPGNRHALGLFSAAMDDEGRRVVTCCYDGTATVHTRDGSEPPVSLAHKGYVRRAEFLDDGRRLVTLAGDNTLRLWSIPDGDLLDEWKGPTGLEFNIGLDVSPDGRHVAATHDQGGMCTVFDLDRREEPVRLLGHDPAARVRSVRFSDDGTRIATAGADGKALVFRTRDWEPLFTLQGPEGSVEDVAFSPDGRYIATAHHDHAARLWSATDGHPISILRGHQDQLTSLDFDPTGRRLVTASYDRTARVWIVDPEELLEHARARAYREPTPTEMALYQDLMEPSQGR